MSKAHRNQTPAPAAQIHLKNSAGKTQTVANSLVNQSCSNTDAVQGHAFIFRKLYANIPKDDKKQFLPGKIPYEFYFQKGSTATIVPQVSKQLQKLHHFADALGRQEGSSNAFSYIIRMLVYTHSTAL